MDQLRGFLDYLRLNRNVSAHTVEAYHSDLSQFIAFAAAHLEKAPEALGPADLELGVVRGFLADLHRQRQSRASVARRISALRAFGRWLVREEKIDAFINLMQPLGLVDVSRTGVVSVPRVTRWNSARMVGSTSRPSTGLVNRTAACPGSTVPVKPACSSASCSVRARSVCSHL